MWSLNLERLKTFAPESLGAVAIETGTCRGNGARALAKHFSLVITIELSPELHQAAKERLKDVRAVECRQGNSPAVLRDIIPTLSPSDRTFFFLDAHWSGDASVEWTKSEWQGYGLDTAHLGSGPSPTGPEQCPLLEELRAIAECHQGPAYILIDDTKNIPAAGAGFKNKTFAGEDWSHLSREKILALLAPRLEQFHELTGPEQYFISLSRISLR